MGFRAAIVDVFNLSRNYILHSKDSRITKAFTENMKSLGILSHDKSDFRVSMKHVQLFHKECGKFMLQFEKHLKIILVTSEIESSWFNNITIGGDTSKVGLKEIQSCAKSLISKCMFSGYIYGSKRELNIGSVFEVSSINNNDEEMIR